MIRRDAAVREKTGLVAAVKSCTKQGHSKDQVHWDSILVDCCAVSDGQKLRERHSETQVRGAHAVGLTNPEANVTTEWLTVEIHGG